MRETAFDPPPPAPSTHIVAPGAISGRTSLEEVAVVVTSSSSPLEVEPADEVLDAENSDLSVSDMILRGSGVRF